MADITPTQDSSPKHIHNAPLKKASLADFTSSILGSFLAPTANLPVAESKDVMKDPLYLKAKHILKMKTTDAVSTKPRLEYVKYFTYN